MLKLWFLTNVLLWQFDIRIFGLKLGLNVALLAVLGAVWIFKKQRITSLSSKMTFAISVALLLSFIVALVGPCTDNFQKILITAPVLAFLTLVGLEVGWRATESDWVKLQNVAVWALLLGFAGVVVDIILPDLFTNNVTYRGDFKFSGFYSEPSFVAFSLFPCVLILLENQCKKLRRRGLLALCGLVLLSRSSTLFVLIVAWGMYQLLKRRDLYLSLYIAVGGILLILLASIVSYDILVAPTVERIVGVAVADSVENISSLVYLQGWQDAWDNLLRTNGLGLGFNMMGCSPLPEVPARAILADVYGLSLNAEDGSVLFGKLISETGVVGLLLFAALIWWWFNIELKLFKSDSGQKSTAKSIQLALIMSFIATSLIRSPGYFSGSFFILVVAVAAVVKWQSSKFAKPLIVQSENNGYDRPL